jgi:inactivated superfamily I helicase
MTEFNKILDNVATDQSAFFLYFDEHEDQFDVEVNYLDEDNYGQIVYQHRQTGRWVYVNYDENNAEVHEAEEVGRLWVGDQGEVLSDECLHTLIENDFCGQAEELPDDGWFFVYYNFIH